MTCGLTAGTAPSGRRWRDPVTAALPSRGWRTEGAFQGAVSIGVFGNRGDRFSIVVVPAESLPRSSPCGEVEWSLVGPGSSGTERVLFALQWTMEVRGSGCLALCGRELPIFPVRPA